MIMALSLLEQGFRDLTSPIEFVRAGGFFENFLYGLQFLGFRAGVRADGAGVHLGGGL
jgi:hypothetical protein